VRMIASYDSFDPLPLCEIDADQSIRVGSGRASN